jgi:RHS repeat-associated protein
MDYNSQVDFDATYTWDTQGRMTATSYGQSGANGAPAYTLNPNSPSYTMQYDGMGRLSGMKDASIGVGVASAGYGVAGEMLGVYYFGVNESRTYNTLLQMTRQTASGMIDMQYLYTAGQNNGRVAATVDGVMNETVNYTYDSVNRLTNAASTAPGGWNQSYTYDGFGNMTAASAAGAFQGWSTTVDPATNRVVGGSYDANGNTQSPYPAYPYAYDVENRMVNGPSGAFVYDHAGKRVLKANPSSMEANVNSQEFAFYGVNGQRLVTLTCPTSAPNCNAPVYNVYFGGKLVVSQGVTVVTDRLGSVRANSNGEKMAYLPYGQERTSTPDGREKFGSYFRDNGGQDYADQRYYGVGGGRFYTPDPYKASSGPSDPGSWNRYAYVEGDPINFLDSQGLYQEAPDDPGTSTYCQDNPADQTCTGNFRFFAVSCG